MKILGKIFINALLVFALAYLLPGISVRSFLIAVVVAIVLGILNFIVRPILVFLTLPITILTLGIFLLVINAVIILITGRIVPGFQVDGFLWALLFGAVFSVAGSWVNHENSSGYRQL